MPLHTHQNGYNQKDRGTSLLVQWVGLHAPNAGGLDLIPGRELDPACMLGLRVRMPQLKILHAARRIPRSAAETRGSQDK